jgi:hypothetical protein
MHRRAPRPRLETDTAGDGPADTVGEQTQNLPVRRRESVIVVVPLHYEALNLPGGVSDETNPGGSPRSHRS